MKKYSLFSIVLLWGVMVFGQETSGYEIPNFAAKTPEAASFLKYGEYPVDLSTGVPNISIPLYTVDLGDYKMPISLNYHASGIKVNQEATWVGLGWNLNYGAQVILSVRDDVDENNNVVDDVPENDEINDYWQLHPFLFNGGPISQRSLDKSRVKDVYSFSSPTANGNFYIKDFAENEVVIFPPDASFKVKLLGASRKNMGFEITDSSGNIYMFSDTKEVSVRTLTHDDDYISAWYVDQIKTSSNKVMNFDYDNDINLYDFSHSQRIEVKQIGHNTCGTEIDRSIQDVVTPVIEENGTTITHTKKIKYITFDNGQSRVEFERLSGREDMFGNGSYLNTMLIKQLENNVFVFKKGFQFNYSYFITDNNNSGHENKRLKLENIMDFLDGVIWHSFVYSDINLPSKVSQDQDYFGYYNNNQGTGLIPKHFISNQYVSEVGGADRRINTIRNQAAILKEIHYPTGGWTKFNYETNTYFGIDEFDKYDLKIVNGSPLTGSGFASFDIETAESEAACLQDPAQCIQTYDLPFTAVNATGTLKFNITNDGTAEVHHQFIRVTVFNSNMEEVWHYKSSATSIEPIVYDFNSLDGGKIQVEAYGSIMSIYGLQLRYVNNDRTPKNVYGGGVRIKEIENYNYDSALISKKQYDYADINDTAKTSGKLVNNLITTFVSNIFYSITLKNECVGDAPLPPTCCPAVDFVSTYSFSSNSRYGIEGNSIVYKYVKEKFIDEINGSKCGYTAYEFSTEGDDIPLGDPSVQIYTPWKRGQVLEKKYYKSLGNVDYLIKKEKNNYFDDPSKVSYINGFKLFRHCTLNFSTSDPNPLHLTCPYNVVRFNEECHVPSDVFMAYEAVSFNYSILWHYLKNTEIEERFYNNSNVLTNVVTTNKTYNYNNPVHQQLSSQVTQSSKGETLETKYYYPQDIEMDAEPEMGGLIAKNIIATPIVTQSYRAGNKLSEQKIVYKDWGNDLIAPETVQTSKGTLPLENRLHYNKMDNSNGNPLEIQRENGTLISYIWGYNKTLPIAKIENATNAEVETALGESLGTADEHTIASVNLRTLLPNAMVTTYTYIPLVGVSTITDPKGDMTTYIYDSFGRLKEVRDNGGNTLSENEYHYKN